MVKFLPSAPLSRIRTVDRAPVTGIAPLDRLFDRLKVKKMNRVFMNSANTPEGLYWGIGFEENAMEMEQILRSFRSLDCVESAELIPLRHLDVSPDDCLFNADLKCWVNGFGYEQWALKNDGYISESGPTSKVDADIDADQAWDITTGDSTVVLAILDTGVDWEHPELRNNLWVNPAEDGNGDGKFTAADTVDVSQGGDFGDINGDGYPGIQGVDDDGDGYADFEDPDIKNVDYDGDGIPLCGPDGIVGTADDDADDKRIAAGDDDENGLVDDVIGWDFTASQYPRIPSRTWNPRLVSTSNDVNHGTRLASIAAARGNNMVQTDTTMMAGVAWKCRIMIIRLPFGLQYDAALTARAIDYTRKKGAHIINMSFGGNASNVERVAVENAFSAGLFLAASAGNENDSVLQYPAGYSNVCGVMSTNYRDQKGDASNYNAFDSTWYDLCAPGSAITFALPRYAPNPMYPLIEPVKFFRQNTNGDATSYSTAFVSGTAILLKAKHPSWSGKEILHQLRNTAEDIEGDLNQAHRGRMGEGRLNAYAGLGYFNAARGSIKRNRTWRHFIFLMDTARVDSMHTLSLLDTLTIASDAKAGMILKYRDTLRIMAGSRIFFPKHFYLEGNDSSIVLMERNSKLVFGDSCDIRLDGKFRFVMDSACEISANKKLSIVLLDSSQFIIKDNARVILPNKLYVETNDHCALLIGKNASVVFGDSSEVRIMSTSTLVADTGAVVTLGSYSLFTTSSDNTIEFMPNDTVKVGSEVSFYIDGCIKCKGTGANRITFAGKGTGTWNGITVHTGATQGITASVFDYVTFKSANVALETRTDSVHVTNCIFDGNETGLKSINASPLVNDNTFKSNLYAGLYLTGQTRTISGNRINSNSSYGIIADGTSNLWQANHADSNNVGVQFYGGATSVFHSIGGSTNSGNTFRHNSSRGIVSDNSSPVFTGSLGADALNACHDNNSPSADIDALNNSVLSGVGNYVLNGVTLYNDASSTLSWGKPISSDPIPNAPPPPRYLSSLDTLKSAINLRFQGQYTSCIALLKDFIDGNHSGAYAARALRLMFNVYNDAQYILVNGDPISVDITGARNAFDAYLQSLGAGSPSSALRLFAKEVLANHKMARHQFISADSLFGILGDANQYSDIEKRCLYGQAIARKILQNQQSAKEKTDLLRSRYPNEKIGVVAKLFIGDPLTSEEAAMIMKSASGIPTTRVESAESGAIELFHNYPNPFNPVTEIQFRILKPDLVRLEIVDILGRVVAIPLNEHKNAGLHSVRFDGGLLRSGIYFYKLIVSGGVYIRKMMLLH